MKKFGIALGVGMLTMAFYGFQPAAFAADYPDDVIVPTNVTLTLNATTLVGGETLVVKAKASGEDNPTGDLDITFMGKSYSESGNDITVSIETPKVDDETNETVTATFTPDDAPQAGASHDAILAAPLGNFALPAAIFHAPSSDTATVTLLPVGSDSTNASDASELPDTGADSNLVPLLIVGGILILAGAGGIYVARRRRTTAV